MRDLLQIQDYIITPILFVVFLIWSNSIKNKHLEEKPHYHFFVRGLVIKLFAGLAFGAVYMFYYNGGDTQYYFTGARSIWRMLSIDSGVFIKLILGDQSPELISYFNWYTGWPTYFDDHNAWSVCRFSVPFYVLGMGSYFGTTLVMNFFLYRVVWHFYELLVKFYPEKWKLLGQILFYVPSVAFWGSGLLKDIYTYTGIMIFFVLFHRLIVEKKYNLKNIFLIVFWSYLLISIRPFIFYALGASTLLWIGFARLKNIENTFMRTIALPGIFALLWLAATLGFTRLSSMAGEHYSSVDAMLERAVVVQDDLTRSYYGENSYDIGDFDASIPGILKKAPVAIGFGLYRPFLWEARSPLMLFSGLENLLLLFLSIYFLAQHRIIGLFRELLKQPFMLGVFVFAISFTFMVGLTTANFGALVRYRIPVVPLFLMVLVLTRKQKSEIASNDLIQ